jgi:photosystem II stability/assembly factor-like uncharacterized protein
MKRVILVLAAMVVVWTAHAAAAVALSTGGGGWSWLTPQPQNDGIYSIDYVTAQEGWAVGEPRVVLHTVDGGVTWQAQGTPLASGMTAVDFADAQHGWAVGVKPGPTTETWGLGAVIRTGDGGTSWSHCTVPATGELRAVSFADGSHGCAVGADGAVLTTADGGATWTGRFLTDGPWLWAVDQVDAQHIWVAGGVMGTVGWMPFLASSEDGGASWQTQSQAMPSGLVRDVDMADSLIGWAVGESGLFHTTDGGASWTDVGDATTAGTDGDKVVAVGASAAWVTAFDEQSSLEGRVFRTLDAGASWQERTLSPADWGFADIVALDASTAVVTGRTDQSVVVTWTTTDGGVTWACPGATAGMSCTGVSFPTPNDGWAVGYDETENGVLHTSDGGQTWTPQTLPGGWTEFAWFSPQDVEFADTLHGWAVGAGDLRPAAAWTDDGGATWQAGSLAMAPGYEFDADLYAVDFGDLTHGWAVGYDGLVVRTVDGGRTWAVKRGGDGLFTAAWTDVAAVGAARCWVVGTDGPGGYIARTSDGGAHWSTAKPRAARRKPLASVCFVDKLNGWAVGNGGLVLRTVDGGATWQSVSTGVYRMDFSAVDFVDAQRGWIANAGEGIVLRTTDGGRSWRMQDTGALFGMASLDAVDAKTAYLCGDRGVLGTTTGGISPIDPTAPRVTISKPSGLWHNHPVKLGLAVTTTASGHLMTFVNIDGSTNWADRQLTIVPTEDGAWDGLHTVKAAAMNVAGNGGPTSASIKVGLDTSMPTTSARNNVRVAKGASVTLRYRIDDWKPGCGAAKATLKIMNQSGKVIRSKALGTKKTNALLSYRYRCDLPPGVYGWYIYARDIAGNPPYKMYYSLIGVPKTAGMTPPASAVAAPILRAGTNRLAPFSDGAVSEGVRSPHIEK